MKCIVIDSIFSQDDAPDPNLIKIKINGHDETFAVNREMAIEHSLYFERIMSGPWANARTMVVELEEGDNASPYNVGIFIKYVEYLRNPLEEVDPLNDIDDFNTFAELWLFADYIQSNTLANAIMDEIVSKASEDDDSDDMAMTKETFLFWWNETDGRPSFAKLRGLMVAMLVASDIVQEDTRRHELMLALPADAQQAIVDEIMRQHRDLKYEIQEGDPKLRDHLSPAGERVLDQIRARMAQKVVAKDFHATYGN